MIYHVRKSSALRERWKTDLEAVARQFGLGDAEYEAIADKDLRPMRAYQEMTLHATAEMRRRLEAAKPDVILAFSNDHLLNWPINNMPELTVGIGEEYRGPADWFDEWLAMEKYVIPGHSGLARHLLNDAAP